MGNQAGNQAGNQTADLAENFRALRLLISQALTKSGRKEDSLTLIAVSKTRTAEEIKALYQLGHRDFGENYVQELLEKANQLANLGCTETRWHFIGHLQSNKVKVLLPVVHSIHSVDSVRLAQEISKRASQPVKIFLSVNMDREPSKSGFMPEEVPAASLEIGRLPGIDLQGLMCIPRPMDSSHPFSRLRALELQCRPHTHGGLSMGMSEDFELAIQEGATAIRVGTRLFGERNLT